VSQQKATNITWHHGKVTPEERAALNGHRGAVLWFTGLSGSGKSTLATTVERELFDRGIHTWVLDGDNVRHGLNSDLGFSPEDRHQNIRRVGEVAKLFADAGLVTMTAFISPYEADRALVREMNPPGRFVEIYCKCGLDICEQRDAKGLYRKAREGAIGDFTGISAPYEVPRNPEVAVDTGNAPVAAGVAAIVAYLEKNGIIPVRT
jgi:adenylylsulfate kinase